MPLIPTAALVERAALEGHGLAAFNVITLEHAEAVVAGAAAAGRPVILQVSENAVRFHGGALAPLTSACVALARSTQSDVALHLDHVRDVTLLEQVDPDSFGSVMIDASHLPYQENVLRTQAVVRWARERGLWVEAELGRVGGKNGEVPLDAHQPGARTDVDEAADFVAQTGVDGLAVAVGSSHAMVSRTATLDQTLIGQLHAALSIPLVLHGSSGVPAAELSEAVRNGIVKVNIGTALNIAFTAAVRAALTADVAAVDPRLYLAAARAAMAGTVTEAIASLGPRVG